MQTLRFPHRRRWPEWFRLVLVVTLSIASGLVVTSPAAFATSSHAASDFDCKLNINGYFTGAYGTAAAMGWAGNQQGVVACLGGNFLIQNGIYKSYGFGIYNGSPTTWTNADGYLPALITSFSDDGASVSITEFADRVVLGGDPFVLLYSRVAVRNPTSRTVDAAPDPSAGLVPLNVAPDAVAAHHSAVHDYVIATDRFGNDYPWPTAQAMSGAGYFGEHFTHMRSFWDGQLSQIAQLSLPDRSLENAYRAGFIYTQIARSGDQLHTGVNGYQSEFSHDVIGILTNLFTQGYFTDAHALLTEAQSVVGSEGQYVDGLWSDPWPWAVYLLKTGDLAFVRANFSTEGAAGSATPSIEDAAHAIAANRTGPGGIMSATDDIDTYGYWTIDDYEALLGLAAYRYVASRVGDGAEVAWATQQYDSLLSATNQALAATIARYHLTYLPCSIFEPDTANRCAHVADANWASPMATGLWSWDAQLFGAPMSGPGMTLVDATYAYGFARLRGKLPPDTFGGFPDDYYSTGYNAGAGTAGLAGQRYRSQAIASYEFMIANTQSGPLSWWESATAPARHDPWVGSHPAAGQGSSPHAWGIAQANDALLASLVAQRSDGSLIVGRGVPTNWLSSGRPIAVTNFPSTNGRRLGIDITGHGRTVMLILSGARPSGSILFELPAFVGNLAATSAGHLNQQTGTVQVPPTVRTVTVQLRRALPA